MLLWILAGLVGAVLLYAAYLYWSQDRLVFFPSRELTATPSAVGLEFEDVFIVLSDGERIHGWFLPADPIEEPGSSSVVLYCHGNAGNISHRLEPVRDLVGLGFSVLLFDYRGYGRSDGAPSERKLYADATASWRWLTEVKGFMPQQIVIYGRSLGGAVAIELAARVPCTGLVVESSFTSASDMAKGMFPLVPVHWLLRYRLDSIAGIRTVSCPVVVAHSPSDEIVPFRMGQALFEAVPHQRKCFVTLTGGHNEASQLGDLEYRRAVEGLRSPAAGR